MNHEKHEKTRKKKVTTKSTEYTEIKTPLKPDERRLTSRDEMTDFLLYTAPDGQVKVECILHDETIWLTQDRIAELFGVQRPAITKHLKNIFESGELEEKVVSSFLEHTTFSSSSPLSKIFFRCLVTAGRCTPNRSAIKS